MVVFFSQFVKHLEFKIENLNGLSLVVGLAIIKALEKECKIDIKALKLNGLMTFILRGAKLAGILLEKQYSGSG